MSSSSPLMIRFRSLSESNNSPWKAAFLMDGCPGACRWTARCHLVLWVPRRHRNNFMTAAADVRRLTATDGPDKTDSRTLEADRKRTSLNHRRQLVLREMPNYSF